MYVQKLQQRNKLMISNVAFNHTKTTSLQYGLVVEPGNNLFVMGDNDFVFRVHPRTIETAFEWSCVIECALNNGVNTHYIPNPTYEKPYVGPGIERKSLQLSDLTKDMIQRAVHSLGKNC
jgi:hypothetical protein